MSRHAAAEDRSRAGGLTADLTSVRTTLVLFAVIIVVYLATANYDGSVVINDILMVDKPAWALAKLHTLNLDHVYLQDHAFAFSHAGHVRSDRYPGPIFLSYPFYLLGPAHFSVVPGAVMAATVTASALAFMHRALVRVVAPLTALGAVLLMAFATGTWTVAGAEPWTQGPVMLGLAIGVWALSSERLWIAGLGYGLAVFSRPHTAVVAAVVGVREGWVRRDPMPVVKVAAGSLLGLGALLVYVHANSGDWSVLQGTYVGRSDAVQSSLAKPPLDTWGSRIAGAVVSPQRGLLVLSPFLLLLLPGLLRAWRVAPSWVRSTTLGGLGYLALQLMSNGASGGGSFFSYRVTLGALLLQAPLLALSWEQWTARAAWRSTAFMVLAALATWWHALAALGWRLVPYDTANWRRWDVRVALRESGVPDSLLAALFAAALVALLLALARQGARRPPNRA